MRAFTLSEAVELCRQRHGSRPDEDRDRLYHEMTEQQSSFAPAFRTSPRESQWQTQ